MLPCPFFLFRRLVQTLLRQFIHKRQKKPPERNYGLNRLGLDTMQTMQTDIPYKHKFIHEANVYKKKADDYYAHFKNLTVCE